MPELPQRKVGIVACSGEELAEGTVTRLAALRVLEQLRPGRTVTICLPLFLAGGEGDRAFARFYPTIALDGCERRCAARGTEQYSGKPAASVVVSEFLDDYGNGRLGRGRRLNENGYSAVDRTAARVVSLVDELLGSQWNRRLGMPLGGPAGPSLELDSSSAPVQATCACGSGIPVQVIELAGESVTIIALPLLLEQLRTEGKAPGPQTTRELLDLVKIYNEIPPGSDETLLAALGREYEAFFAAAGTPA